MAGLADVKGDPGTWEIARALGRELDFPVGPYEARVPTANEMNAVLPYIVDRFARFAAGKYFCENAEITLAHVLGITVPRQGFPDSSGYNPKTGLDWLGFNKDGFDQNGCDRTGFNRYGRDKDGFDREGYNQDGFDREGYNRKGTDWYGTSREAKVTAEVAGWTDMYAAAIAAHIATLNVEAPPPAKAPTKKAATKKTATPKKAVLKKAVPVVKKPAPKKLVTAGGRRVAAA